MSRVPLVEISATTSPAEAGAAAASSRMPSEKNASHVMSSVSQHQHQHQHQASSTSFSLSPSSSSRNQTSSSSSATYGQITAASPASSVSATAATAPNPASAPPKRRSCVVCRSRKVRCDRLSPCTNCRRANITCISPSTDRPPRWARRLARVANNAASNALALQDPDPAADQVMDRLRTLESLVKDLSGQLEQANAAAAGAAAGGHFRDKSSPEGEMGHERDASSSASNVQKQFGRLVLQDANRSRYVSSGFWSRVNDELDGLETAHDGLGADDSDSSEEDDSPGKSSTTQELDRAPSERHAFLFGHNLGASAISLDLREFHPLPSQIPFLLDIFSENVNALGRIIHMPTIAKMVRDLRGSGMTSLTPANEALLFSIFYAAITSMEEEDVLTNFGSSKADLNLKYRLGLEHALAKADFLNVPDLVLVQAFTIFLFLLRRHDSPRFVWMMTGLLIRMGQALGLHRDGVHFPHLTPYEIEMRRRLWWLLCTIDVRASEDQGTDYTIPRGSFDTKMPLNINDADINPETTEMPTAREGITDMTFTIVSLQISDVTKQMMAQMATAGGVAGMEEQSRLLNEIYQKLDRGYLQYSVDAGDIANWVGIMIARLVMAKMTLFVYLPILFSPQGEHISAQIRTKLLVAAIENAEYNHVLNAEHACRHWRWVFQTYTHWHAVVYLLIEICRRPWSPIVERAWVALHSQWLIPSQAHMDKNMRFWVPLRRLKAKARKHRAAEVERLRNDPQAAEWLEREDQKIPVPSSPGPFPAGSNAVELFRERWRQLLAMPLEAHGHDTGAPSGRSAPASVSPPPAYSPNSAHSQSSTNTTPAHVGAALRSSTNLDAAGFQTSQTRPLPGSTHFPDLQSAMTTNALGGLSMTQSAVTSSYNAPPAAAAAGSTATGGWSMGPGFLPWAWPDTDPTVDDFANLDMDVLDAIDVNMDMDGEVDWYNWVQSAGGMEWNAGQNG